MVPNGLERVPVIYFGRQRAYGGGRPTVVGPDVPNPDRIPKGFSSVQQLMFSTLNCPMEWRPGGLSQKPVERQAMPQPVDVISPGRELHLPFLRGMSSPYWPGATTSDDDIKGRWTWGWAKSPHHHGQCLLTGQLCPKHAQTVCTTNQPVYTVGLRHGRFEMNL